MNFFKNLSFKPAFLDRIEQYTAAALLAYLAYRVWPSEFSAQNAFSILVLFSEGMVVLFLLARKTTEGISMRFSDWVIAAAGSFLVLLVGKGGAPISMTLGMTLALVGIIMHVGAKLSLNQSYGLVAANRGIKAKGMYRLVRHPMYAGYVLSHAGLILLSPSAWNAAIYFAVWGLLVARIFAEERILIQDQAYRDLCSVVRYRLFPGVF